MTIADAPDTKAHDNVLDLTLAHFSPTTEEELYEAVRSATAADLEKFRDAYAAFAATGTTHAPVLKEGELRPYFPSGDMPDWLQGRFNIDNHALTEDGADWRAVDAVKHRLLYCHSVAFDDPMPGVVSLAAAQLRIPQPWHNGLLNYINFLLHFRSLIRSHVVCPVAHESYLPAHNRPDYIALGEEIEARADKSKLPDIDEILEVAPAELQALWRQDLAQPDGGVMVKGASLVKSCERISGAIAGVKNAPGRLSLYFPFRYDVRLLERCGEVDSLREFGDRDNRSLNGLIDVDMPNLGSLDPKEISSIRAGAEFEQWRMSLKDALACAASLPGDLINRRAEMRKVVREKLSAGKRQLEKDLKKSPVLAGFRKGSVTLIAGVASAAVVHYLTNNNLQAALWGVAAAGAVQAAAEVQATPGVTDAQKATLAHYVAVLR